MKLRAIFIGLVMLIGLVPGVVRPAALLQPLMVGFDHYFKIDWRMEGRQGQPVVFGHIFNDAGFGAANVRLLIEGLDDRGAVLNQRVAWLGTLLTPGTTAPFEVVAAGPAPAYRVRVFSFDWVQRGKGVR